MAPKLDRWHSDRGDDARLPSDLADIVDGVEAFARAEVVSRHEQHARLLDDPREHYDADGRYVPEVVELIRELRQASAKAGYFNLSVPTELGGEGLGYLAYYLAWLRVYGVCTPHHWLAQFALSHWAYGPSIALEGLTDTAKGTVLPRLLSGEDIMCFGMSEPDAGSDAMAMKTRAEEVEGGWRINGRKIWTTHAPIADWMVVFAVTDAPTAAARRGGVSAFMVPMDTPGLHVHSIIKMWGDIGGNEGETVFEDVHVEPWQLIGELGHGMRIAMKGVSLGRMYNSARAVATGRWALRMALDYSQERHTFGKPLAEHQAIAHPLAKAATDLHAAYLVGLDTARLLDSGDRARIELPMTKYLSVTAALEAVDRAMQTHGGIGFSNELGLTDAYRTFRTLRIADGADEILLRTVFNGLLAAA